MKKILLFLLMLFVSLSSVNAALDDAVVYYAFDDDNSGYDINGATGTNISKLGEGAMSFDGVNDDVSFSTISDVSKNHAYSVSLWVNLNSTGTTQNLFTHTLSSSDRVAITYNDAGGDVRFSTYNGASFIDPVSGSLSTGGWHHIVVTYDGVSNNRMFIDDTEVFGTNTPSTVATAQARLGSLGGTFYLNGSMDEVGVWNRTLTTDEITELYNGGAGELAKNVANDYLFYAPLDSLTDISDSGNDATGNNGVTYTNSSLLGNGAMDFDGTDDYIDSSIQLNSADDWTISGWFDATPNSGSNVLFSQRESFATMDFYLSHYGSTHPTLANQWEFYIGESLGAGQTGGTFGSDNIDVGYNFIVLSKNGSNYKLYVNNVLKGVFSNTKTWTTSDTFYIGKIDSTAYFKGGVDDVSVYTRTLSTDEISELYNNGTGFNPYAVSPGATITFNNPTNGAYLDNTSFLLNVSFSENTNSTYSLNGATNVTLGTNENLSTANLTGVEGANNLIVYANTSGVLSSKNINFTIDITNPVVVDNLPSEINSYVLDFNSSTCTDTNIDTCVLNIQGSNYDLLTLSNATLTYNGNSTYTITATDLAGNTAVTNGTILVNPYQYWYFEDSVATPITNFAFGGTNFTNFAQFKTYDLGLGTSTLTFEKTGYQTQNFNITLTNTSNINTTYVISNAKIIINMREKATGNLITTDTFTAEFIATVGAVANTSTGQLNVSNLFFLNEDYTVTITSNNWLTEQLFFTFTNQEILEIDAYFIEKNSTSVGTVFIKVVDLGSKPVKGAKVFANQWDSATSSFIAVTQGITGEDGLASLNVILNDENYKFSASKNGGYGESVVEIIDTTENGKTITIPLDSAVAVTNYLLQNLEYTVTESFNNVTNVSTITVTWTNTDGLNTEMCINRYRSIANSEKFQEESCTTGVSGTLIQGYFINSTNVVTLKAEVKYNGDYVPLESFTYYPETSPSKLLLNLGLAPFVIPLLFMISIGIGLYIENIYIGTMLLALSSGISLLLVPTLTNGGITAFLFFMGWMVVASGVKPR